MKKKVVALLLAAMLCSSAALAGCNVSNKNSSSKSSGSTTSASSDEKVTITIKQFKTEIDEQLGKAIEKYKTVAPNVTITYQSIGAGTDIGTVLKADMAANTMPTIFNCIGPSEYAVYKDYLEDLSDQEWLTGHAKKGMLDLLTVDKKVYGVPVSIEGLGLIVNKKIFDDAGIDISNLKTMSDFDKAFSALDSKIKDGSLASKDSCKNLKAVTAMQGAETWVLGDHAENIFLIPEFGDPFKAYDSKTISMKYADTYKEYTDMMLKYSEFADNKQGAVNYTYSKNAIPDISSGKVAVIQQGNWAYGEIAKVDKDMAKNMTLIPMPIGGDKQSAMVSILSQYWVVNKKATDAEKKASKDFLKWLYQSDEGKDIIVNDFGFIPVFDNYGDKQPSDPLSKAVIELNDSGKSVNAVFKGTPDGWGQNVFGAAVQDYISGKKTWDEVVKTAQDGWADAKK